MKKLVRFWKKDVINKLIVLVCILLVVGVAGIAMLMFNLAGSKKLPGVISFFYTSPTPTLNINARFTSLAQTAIVENTPAYLLRAATITPIGGSFMTDTPMPATGTASPTPRAEVSPTPTRLISPTVTTQPTSSSVLDFSGVRCILNLTPQAGRVLEIVDGVTAKVMIDKLVYSVRYIGVDHPQATTYAEAASAINGQLVWGKDVQLYSDPVVKDTVGLLYRYVVIGDKLVNLDLLQKGYALAVDLPTGNACYQAFLAAQQAAQKARLGMWK